MGVEPLVSHIPSSLQEAKAAIAALLHWPNNLGIEFREIHLQTQPQTDLLAVFVNGVADEAFVQKWVMEPLGQVVPQRPGVGRLLPETLNGILPAPRMRIVKEFSAIIRGVLEGATALLFDGAPEAILVETRASMTPALAMTIPGSPYKEVFGPDLSENVALLRKRLRDPVLIAEPQSLPQERAAVAAVLFVEGRTEPALIRQVREWLEHRGGEEALHRGLAGGVSGSLGFLPKFLSSSWPDQAAVLLDAGYVVALVDRLPYAYIAPVTAASLVYGPGDEALRRPVAGWIRFVRVLLAALIVISPALVVALMNYHQEMIPTPFLLGLASVRENAAFPIVAEVVGLEVLQAVLRATTDRLPVPVSPGNAFVGSAVLVGLLVFGGIVAPLPAIVSLVVAAAAYGLPSSELAYIVRAWRWPMIAGAVMFGLFGMAAVGFLLATYLMQAESFTVPFIGETGLKFTAAGRFSSRRKGGPLRAARRAIR